MLRQDVDVMLDNVVQVEEWVGQVDMIDDALALIAETLTMLDKGLLDHSLPEAQASPAIMEARRLVSEWLLPAQTARSQMDPMPSLPMDEVRQSLRSLHMHLERMQRREPGGDK